MASRVRSASVVAEPAIAPSWSRASPALQPAQLGEQEAGLEAGARAHRRTGQALGEGEVVALPGHGGGRQHHVWVQGAAPVEAPHCQAEGVLAPSCAGGLQGAGKSPRGVPSSQWGEPGAEDLSVQGVRQAGREAPTLLLDAHQPATLEGVQVEQGVNDVQQVQFQRLPKGQHAEGCGGRLVEMTQPGLDDLHEPRRGRGQAAQPPDTFLAAKHPRVECAEDNLPQEQDVAFGARLEDLHGRPVDRSPECGDEEFAGIVEVEGGQLESLGQPVLPQGHDGGWSGLPGAQRPKDEDAFLRRQKVREGGRGFVEQVHVVDENRDRVAIAGRTNCPGDLAQHLQPVAGRGELRHEVGEGSEGEASRALCGCHPKRDEPP
jgi:hypothetical protein